MTTQTRRSTRTATVTRATPRVTVFHCVNVLNGRAPDADTRVSFIRMPCSLMTREVFLLKAFEAGAEAVVVLTCPEGACKNLDGNIRAGKRVGRVKKLLDEIGLDGRRLSLRHVSQADGRAIEQIVDQARQALSPVTP